MHRDILRRYGVPTVPGTLVDRYNRRLTEEAESTVDQENAALDAFLSVFGLDMMEEGDPPEDYHFPVDPPDLEEVCWDSYPERERDVLRRYGVPDFDRPGAAQFNRLVVKVTEAASSISAEDGGEVELDDLLKRLKAQFLRAEEAA